MGKGSGEKVSFKTRMEDPVRHADHRFRSRVGAWQWQWKLKVKLYPPVLFSLFWSLQRMHSKAWEAKRLLIYECLSKAMKPQQRNSTVGWSGYIRPRSTTLPDKLCGRLSQYTPPPASWPLTLKVVSESPVT